MIHPTTRIRDLSDLDKLAERYAQQGLSPDESELLIRKALVNTIQDLDEQVTKTFLECLQSRARCYESEQLLEAVREITAGNSLPWQSWSSRKIEQQKKALTQLQEKLNKKGIST